MFDDPSFSSPLCVSLHVSPVARIADNAASCVPNACEMTPKIWNEFSPLLQKQNQKKKKKHETKKKRIRAGDSTRGRFRIHATWSSRVLRPRRW